MDFLLISIIFFCPHSYFKGKNLIFYQYLLSVPFLHCKGKDVNLITFVILNDLLQLPCCAWFNVPNNFILEVSNSCAFVLFQTIIDNQPQLLVFLEQRLEKIQTNTHYVLGCKVSILKVILVDHCADRTLTKSKYFEFIARYNIWKKYLKVTGCISCHISL